MKQLSDLGDGRLGLWAALSAVLRATYSVLATPQALREAQGMPFSSSREPSLGNAARAPSICLGLIGFHGVWALIFVLSRTDVRTEMKQSV